MSYDLPYNPSGFKILVIEDHPILLGATIELLQKQYSEAKIQSTCFAENILRQVAEYQPDLVVLDLAIPTTNGETAKTDTGIQILRNLMTRYPTLNLTVQSANIRALVRLRLEIDDHRGGFTVVDKSLSSQEAIQRFEWALQGITHTKDIGLGLEFKPAWIDMLRLAFHEGLQDKTIAERMCISERTVRLYWSKIQDVLGIYPEDTRRDGKSLRIQTERKAREVGLID